MTMTERKRTRATPPGPKPKAVTQAGAPFERVREPSPEPAEVFEGLDYDVIEQQAAADVYDDCWEDEGKDHDDDDDAASGGSPEEFEETSPCISDVGSVCSSSPGGHMVLLLDVHGATKKTKNDPPGIALSFDDDSWIY